ncbi:putative nicotinate-nucleotide adenylyltransferase [Hypericibacter terrae]|uniref:Probable nicotinate-nucleotide adenylyltransferase n=1 Tax=Hypericibacter terrae TaxID=2602015 RepID=A0A5J6MPG1_9PROT|nr:putative nicotinate-nucleotide adenylyltransferase [Hypericibacter terrae]
MSASQETPRRHYGVIDPARARRRPRVGLLGGSFNPAHEGHRQISLTALHRLGLDEVWWLVSPQNPLKPEAGMAPLAERMATARAVARDPRIRVTDIESRLGTRFTADTLEKLTRRYPGHGFVWLMGADNLLQIHKWRDWQRIFHLLPVAVLARPSYSLKALSAPAAQRFLRSRWPERLGRRLVQAEPPAWLLIHGPLNPASATAIRAARRMGRREGKGAST